MIEGNFLRIVVLLLSRTSSGCTSSLKLTVDQIISSNHSILSKSLVMSEEGVRMPPRFATFLACSGIVISVLSIIVTVDVLSLLDLLSNYAPGDPYIGITYLP